MILWTVACQAPLSMGFSRQEYWSGLLFPCPGDVPNPWIKPGCPILQAGSYLSQSPGKPFYLHVLSLSYVRLFCDLMEAHQASLSMRLSRQEYWSGFPCPPTGDLPDPEVKPTLLYISCIGKQVLYHQHHLGKEDRKHCLRRCRIGMWIILSDRQSR